MPSGHVQNKMMCQPLFTLFISSLLMTGVLPGYVSIRCSTCYEYNPFFSIQPTGHYVPEHTDILQELINLRVEGAIEHSGDHVAITPDVDDRCGGAALGCNSYSMCYRFGSIMYGLDFLNVPHFKDALRHEIYHSMGVTSTMESLGCESGTYLGYRNLSSNFPQSVGILDYNKIAFHRILPAQSGFSTFDWMVLVQPNSALVEFGSPDLSYNLITYKPSTDTITMCLYKNQEFGGFIMDNHIYGRVDYVVCNQAVQGPITHVCRSRSNLVMVKVGSQVVLMSPGFMHATTCVPTTTNIALGLNKDGELVYVSTHRSTQ